eukprot:2592546-Heterocapsa_arctica.AAC.1
MSERLRGRDCMASRGTRDHGINACSFPPDVSVSALIFVIFLRRRVYRCAACCARWGLTPD